MIFKRLFAELFRQKCKKANLMLLLQFLVAVLITIFSYFQGNIIVNDHEQKIMLLIPLLCAIFFAFSFVFLLVYLIITCSQNERINRSQTWRLVPLSDEKIYLVNILSSFVSFIYLGILQVITSIVLFGIGYLFNKQMKDGWDSFISGFKHVNQSTNSLLDLLGLIILVMLVALLAYLLVSFLNFASQSIMDFLPAVSSKFIVTLIRLILIIAIMWLLVQIYSFLKPIISSPFDFIFDGKAVNTGSASGILALIDIVFLAVNMFLISKFFEAKQNK
ncbi:hypothetical protein OZY43_04350 [Lactobacillus sp. ESL0785]|uniref:hypothetical protein n=1 Tax=Lactobacillus sp. ESL0785 TaxID=2983232 RepID=UPI0023F79E2B|nr:hypothetical protein [Lactobacillus sp. ESL0785]WEV70193.1 hypothetical protein OZY43_04350 [Lactobacillus sp. ESL0785]